MVFLFKSKRNQVQVPQEAHEPVYYSTRGVWGYSHHLVSGLENMSALCGKDDILQPSETPLTSQDIVDSLPNQHQTWYWCEICASQATGYHGNQIRALRGL